MLADTHHPDPLSTLVNERERESIAEAIQELPEKERLVLTLYYYEELTMKEIGELLKVTESRVCQIHTKSIMSPQWYRRISVLARCLSLLYFP